MAEEAPRRKSNKPSRLLQGNDDDVLSPVEYEQDFADEDGTAAQYHGDDVIDIPDDSSDQADTKAWISLSDNLPPENQDVFTSERDADLPDKVNLQRAPPGSGNREFLVTASKEIQPGIEFGPYSDVANFGRLNSNGSSVSESNGWMWHVRSSAEPSEPNLEAYHHDRKVFYRVIKTIQPGEELVVDDWQNQMEVDERKSPEAEVQPHFQDRQLSRLMNRHCFRPRHRKLHPGALSRRMQLIQHHNENHAYQSDEDDIYQERRQRKRIVEPFVYRTPAPPGKKDASMQFPDDELAVLREENEALRKENEELRKKVDRLVQTIALNDALPSLLASLKGQSSPGLSSSQATPTPACSSPSPITITNCQSLCESESPTVQPVTISQATAAPAGEVGVVDATPQVSTPHITVPPASQVSVAQVSLPQVSLSQSTLPQISQQQVHIPSAPQVPIMGMPPPTAIQLSLPSQVPMIQQGLPTQVPLTQHGVPSQRSQVPQTVLSQMSSQNLIPSRPMPVDPPPPRMPVRVAPRQSRLHEDSFEISLSNHVTINKKLLDRCNHTNFRKLTSDLLMCLFPRKTLSKSTLVGHHCISKATGLPTNKARLDPEKVAAIIDYVQRITGVSVKAVKEAIRTKLNNEAKRLHRQTIFKRSHHWSTGSTA